MGPQVGGRTKLGIGQAASSPEAVADIDQHRPSWPLADEVAYFEADANSKQQQRSMQYIHTGLVGLLWIKQGRKETGYMVEDTSACTNADASTFRLTKTDGTVYNVLLDGPASLCDCIGFEHRGMNTKDGKGCKHIAALTILRQLGKV